MDKQDSYLRIINKETSVKEVGVIKEPARDEHGIADFDHRPVFSVFDYGTIVPPIPLDNSTIALMGAFNFELLESKNISTHYLGLVDSEDRVVDTNRAISEKITPTKMRVKFGYRIMPEFSPLEREWDYSIFECPGVAFYIRPIEFISRNELPDSSSVWKRVVKREITLQDLGLPEGFKKGDSIHEHLKPILDYSTKFEPEDRYLSPEQARELMHINRTTFDFINETTRKVSNLMTDYANSRGFERLDGKIEYMSTLVADNVCTWHEERLIISGTNLGISKQRIRDKIVQLNSEWYDELERAKKQARKERYDDFRRLMDPEIKNQFVLPSPEFFHAINTLFRAGTNQWINSKLYNIYPEKNESLEDNLHRAAEEFQKQA